MAARGARTPTATGIPTPVCPSGRIYIDACTIIYLVEGAQPFPAHARARIAQLRGGAGEFEARSRIVPTHVGVNREPMNVPDRA